MHCMVGFISISFLFGSFKSGSSINPEGLLLRKQWRTIKDIDVKSEYKN